MNAKEEEKWRQGERLFDAWYEFADHTWPEGHRIARLRALWRGAPLDTTGDTDQKQFEADHLEKGLKSELLSEIQNGSYSAFGRDITNGLDSPIISIPPGMFDQRIDDFNVDWVRSALTSYGRKIIEIRVLPADQGVATKRDVEIALASGGAEEAEPMPPGSGRPNTERNFKAAVLAAVKDNPNFLFEGDRASQAREIRARLFGEGARERDEMSGCNIDSAKRWVGQVARQLRSSSA